MKSLYILCTLICLFSLNLSAANFPAMNCQGNLLLSSKNPYLTKAERALPPQMTFISLHIAEVVECGMERSRFAFLSHGSCYRMTKASIQSGDEILSNLDTILTASKSEFQIFVPRNSKNSATSLQGKLQNQFYGYGTMSYRWNVSSAELQAVFEMISNQAMLKIFSDSNQGELVGTLNCR